ncbi:uncharacterized protein LOC118478399 [Aplysia californica]|uniref:Uncharacterized protein LOC118478399 n=1 Tax=Aplysia californica TaxID=6500 RepID=A0ABM1VZI9_APLCA|nr:uncharacterized protein LOC118478399 [Aplysia californica]
MTSSIVSVVALVLVTVGLASSSCPWSVMEPCVAEQKTIDKSDICRVVWKAKRCLEMACTPEDLETELFYHSLSHQSEMCQKLHNKRKNNMTNEIQENGSERGVSPFHALIIVAVSSIISWTIASVTIL